MYRFHATTNAFASSLIMIASYAFRRELSSYDSNQW